VEHDGAASLDTLYIVGDPARVPRA
jgi:hypothetical protein